MYFVVAALGNQCVQVAQGPAGPPRESDAIRLEEVSSWDQETGRAQEVVPAQERVGGPNWGHQEGTAMVHVFEAELRGLAGEGDRVGEGQRESKIPLQSGLSSWGTAGPALRFGSLGWGHV